MVFHMTSKGDQITQALLDEITLAINLATKEGQTLDSLGKLCNCTGPFLSMIRSGARGPGISHVKLWEIRQGLKPWIKNLTYDLVSNILDSMEEEDRSLAELLLKTLNSLDEISERNKGKIEQILTGALEDESNRKKPASA